VCEPHWNVLVTLLNMLMLVSGEAARVAAVPGTGRHGLLAGCHSSGAEDSASME
jgi:hypothetical protein